MAICKQLVAEFPNRAEFHQALADAEGAKARPPEVRTVQEDGRK